MQLQEEAAVTGPPPGAVTGGGPAAAPANREPCLGARGHGDVPVPGLALADLVVVERAVGTT